MADTERMDFGAEFAEGNSEFNTEMATATATADKAEEEKITYKLADGTMGSRAAFIREKFINDNMSREAIAKAYDLPYRVVYSATVNMANSAEASTRGRTAVNSVIKLTADGKVVLTENGKTLVDGVAYTDSIESLGTLTDKNRNEWIQEQVAAGVSRGDIAKILDLSYGVIYNITKEQEGTRARVEITLPDGSVISRSAYIKEQLKAGKTRGQIAKELAVPYSVVWQATKVEKSAQAKYLELIETLKGYADSVADADGFMAYVEELEKVEIVEKKAETESK